MKVRKYKPHGLQVTDYSWTLNTAAADNTGETNILLAHKKDYSTLLRK